MSTNVFLDRHIRDACIYHLPLDTRVLPQEPGRIELQPQSGILSCVVILGVCLRFKPHWMFPIYNKVVKGHEELTSCAALGGNFRLPNQQDSFKLFLHLYFTRKYCLEIKLTVIIGLSICLYLNSLWFHLDIYQLIVKYFTVKEDFRQDACYFFKHENLLPVYINCINFPYTNYIQTAWTRDRSTATRAKILTE